MIALAFALSLVVSAPRPSAPKPPAQPAEATAKKDPAARAKELFTAASRLYDQARYSEAIPRFEEAYSFRPHPVIYFNIGRCYEQLGETGKAMRAYRDYLRLAPEATDRDTVADAINNLERRLAATGVQQLLVLSEPMGATVEVDGQVLGNTPASIELAAGNHRLKLSAEGREPVERSFVMSTQRATEMTISLRSAPPADAPRVAPPPLVVPTPSPGPVLLVTNDPPRRRLATWVVGGGALAAAAVGTGLLLASNDSVTTLRASSHERAQADQLVTNANTTAVGAQVSYALAGTAAIAAVVLFFVER